MMLRILMRVSAKPPAAIRKQLFKNKMLVQYHYIRVVARVWQLKFLCQARGDNVRGGTVVSGEVGTRLNVVLFDVLISDDWDIYGEAMS